MPLIPAAPALFGIGPATPLATIANAIANITASHPFLHGALVLPLDTARDAGDALLAGRTLLLGIAGLACASTLRTLGLDRGATGGAARYELTAAANGAGARTAIVPLILAPYFLTALERTHQGAGPSTIRLAVAVSLVASIDTPQAAAAIFMFGLAWSAIRLAAPAAKRRLATLGRLALGTILGVILSSPFLASHILPSGIDVALPIPAWPFVTARSQEPAATVIQVLPTIGLACFAALQPRSRGRALLILLAVISLAIASFPLVIGINTLSGAGGRPLFLLCLTIHAATARAAPPAVPPRGASIMAALLLCAAAIAAVTIQLPPALVVANALALAACLFLAQTGRAWSAAPALLSAAWTAVISAS